MTCGKSATNHATEGPDPSAQSNNFEPNSRFREPLDCTVWNFRKNTADHCRKLIEVEKSARCQRRGAAHRTGFMNSHSGLYTGPTRGVIHRGYWLRAGKLIVMVSIISALQACGGGGGAEGASQVDTTTAAPAASSQLEQYTPSTANWSTFATKPFGLGTNTSHDPDGVSWISQDSWTAAKWDGTVYNPSKMTKDEFSNAICPGVDQIRGIREVFYKTKPFADNKNPTKAEVDEWHRIAINHVRALIGYTSDDRQATKDHCMFARAAWGDERKFTSIWDAKYPGTLGSAEGPCQGSTNQHCGASFIPSLEDQVPYLPSGHPGCGTQQGAEGVFSGPKSNIPWSIKWSRGLCNTLKAEGFWGGHVGPWFHREKFGLNFWDSNPSDNNNNAILRAKWTGSLKPSLYCDPSNNQCEPAPSVSQ